MVKQVLNKIKPAGGFAHAFHILLVAMLPTLVFVFVRLNLAGIAVALILLGKWRMFAVRPRHWPANVRANAIDIIVGLSFLVFMTHSSSPGFQLVWAILYAIWLLAIKPGSSSLLVSLQAAIGQALGLSALFLNWGDTSVLVLSGVAWAICYSAARHFFTSFEEPHTRFLAYMWGYFAAALTWVLSHWLLFYGQVSQVTLLLSVIGFGLVGLYYLDITDRLTTLVRRQVVFIMLAIILIVLVFSDWGDKAV
ncbi:hypothetical protein A3D14_02550 [Candidatus Saccharibacteria bacterium RIFCSPHIGHO2_02_FULL_47_12]|nr:MAG: hypothetical protein A3D14_02550 [Candidatus Saccharibacteria bacterium RIFCSPHIGHO2_02_FULL_47_12]